MRILCHAQHLSGRRTLRPHARARVRAERAGHEVHLVEGGRPVPHARDAAEPQASCGSRPSPAPAERWSRSGSTAPVRRGDRGPSTRAGARGRAIRPDVVPRRPLSVQQVGARSRDRRRHRRRARGATRRCESSARCATSSARPATSRPTPLSYEERVLAQLRARFDGILVHADPAFTRIEEHFARVADFPVAVEYTGFVTQPAAFGDRSLGRGSLCRLELRRRSRQLCVPAGGHRSVSAPGRRRCARLDATHRLCERRRRHMRTRGARGGGRRRPVSDPALWAGVRRCPRTRARSPSAAPATTPAPRSCARGRARYSFRIR